MNKILFLSNTANFSKFNLPYMRWFRGRGRQVDYCSAGEETVADCDRQYTISIARSPFSLRNFKAYRELKKILAENHYDILHCHTPMGGVIDRLAAQNQDNLHGARLSFLQGRSALELDSVLSDGKMAFALHGRDCDDKRGGL